MSASKLIEGQPAPVAIDFTEESIELFPTRFKRRRFTGVEGLNRRLRTIILDREQKSQGVKRSNQGGWHSEPDLLRWEEPEIAPLAEMIRDTVKSYIAEEPVRPKGAFSLALGLEAWANVMRAGHYQTPHVHPRSNFAVVYYVDAGDPPQEGSLSGHIEFIDPRNRVQMLDAPGVDGRDGFRVRPATSTMLVFPAWLYHYAHPYAGTRPRISIASNVVVQGLAEQPP